MKYFIRYTISFRLVDFAKYILSVYKLSNLEFSYLESISLFSNNYLFSLKIYS